MSLAESQGLQTTGQPCTHLISGAFVPCSDFTAQYGKWHMGAVATWMTPHGRGFDTSLGYLSGGEDHFTQIQRGNIFGSVGIDFYKTDAPAYGLNGTYACYTYNDAILETLAMAEHNPSTKLFLYIALQVMHAPEQVTEQFQSVYDAETYTSNYAGAMCNGSFALAQRFQNNL